MRIIDLIATAFRNVRRQKLRSALTIFAVVIGATSVTIMLALVTGAKGFFLSQFEANGTLQQVEVSPQTDLTWSGDKQGGPDCQGCVKLTDTVVDKLAAIPHVVGAARVTSVNNFEGAMLNGQKVRLNNLVAYDANGIVTNNVLAGRDISASDTTGVVTITADIADKLGYHKHYSDLLNKTITLVSQGYYSGVGANVLQQYQEQQQYFQQNNGGGGQNFEPTPTQIPAKIVGVIDTSSYRDSVRVPLVWAHGMEEQQNYQQPPQQGNRYCPNGRCPQAQPVLTVTDELALNGYQQVTLKVDNTSNAAGVVSAVKKLGLGAADAQSFIDSILRIFNIISLVLGGIGAIALIVATIGVINTMVMAILERTREIGVMRACGATRGTIRRLFTIEAGVLGFLGGVFGVIVGYGLTDVANLFINPMLASSGIKSHNIISLPLWLIIAVIGATTIIGMLAGLYPAFRAARLNPVEALRYE
jgi:putative ABC transport system permease protein